MKHIALALLVSAPALLVLATAAPEHHASAPFFKKLDRSGDGLIKPEEVERSVWVRRLDTNHDGGVDTAELAKGWDDFPMLRAALANRFPEALGYPPTNATPAATPPAAPTSATVDASPRQGAKALAPAPWGIGTYIPDLPVKLLGGDARLISALADGHPLVIANVSTSCPISKRCIPALLALQKGNPAARFVFLATNREDSEASLRQALPGMTIARDESGALLKALAAKASTDTFLLDARRTLQYRGAVDDQYGLGYSLDAPRIRFLADALEAVRVGRAPMIAATEAPGCELDLSKFTTAKTGTITFHNRISRILQQNCQECHRSGGVAPFPLETPEQVTEHAGMIKKMVSQRLMPPWFAAAPQAGQHSPWANDRSLPDGDRDDLLGWLASGRTLGEEKDAPLPRTWGAGEWAIGKPDAVFQIPQPIQVKATGTMAYQTARVPTSYNETRYLTAIEIVPTAREVVHHVLVFADAGRPLDRLRNAIQRGNGTRRADDEEDGGFVGIYVPGNSVLQYPTGFAKELPAGATLRFQIHYTPNGTATQDQVKIGFKFASTPPRHVVHNTGISNRRFNIPPGAADHKVEATLPVPKDAVLLAFLPHMHVRGKAWRYEVTGPGGGTQMLLDVPRYDFNWQLLYRLSEPYLVPGGSVIKATAWYDNSTGNPANPDPTKLVRWGPQTFDEMMLGYVEYYIPSEPVRTAAK